MGFLILVSLRGYSEQCSFLPTKKYGATIQSCSSFSKSGKIILAERQNSEAQAYRKDFIASRLGRARRMLDLAIAFNLAS